VSKILAIVPDAFGGRGGIAQYNRDFLTDLCTYPGVCEVTVIPRNIVDSLEDLPDALSFIKSGATGKISFALAALQFGLHNDFDLIVCGHINLLPLAYAVQRLNRAPLFLMIYGIEAWQPGRRKITNYLTRYLSGVVSISDITLERFQQWSSCTHTKSFVLPNSVPLDGYTPGTKPEELLQRHNLQGKKILLTLGRVVERERCKGFDEIIEILPTLLKHCPNLVYLVAGAGHGLDRLKAKVKSLNLSEHVIFTGYVPESSKVDYYRLADAFVMPSQGEGFGFVLLEAMACGIPTMGSQLDGTREALMNGKLGILVDPTDPASICEGVLETLKRPRAVPKELSYFSAESFKKRLHVILEQII